jgi:hypothetical protein
MYLFLGRKGMFSCFYVKKIVPVDMALHPLHVGWRNFFLLWMDYFPAQYFLPTVKIALQNEKNS